MSHSKRPAFFESIRNRFHPLWRIRRIRWLHAILTRLDFPVWARIPAIGLNMRIYWFRDLPWLFDSVPKEPEMLEVVEQVCRTFQPRVFWDVGANLGWYCWLVNARTKLDRAVAIEPLPENCRLLEATIHRNRLPHIQVVQTAVADRAGTVNFTIDTKSGKTSQLSELYATGGESAIAHTYQLETEMQVNCTTLDELIEQGQPVPDLMKVDVEEAEHLVFKGASRLLGEGRTVLVFECHRLEAIEILKLHGYSIFSLDELHNFLGIPLSLAEQAAGITASLKPWNQ
jgi:FkbM family methyltransferase